MRFLKYNKYGGYHWKWYKNGVSFKKRYFDHVNKVKEWVEEINVLDVGCGDGLITYMLGGKGIDNEPMAIRAGKRRNANVELGNAYDISYPDETFDSVFMGDVLEHLEKPQKAIKEARRVLRKYLYLAVPIEEDGIVFTPDTLKKLVESVGFELVGKIQLENKKLYGKFRKI